MSEKHDLSRDIENDCWGRDEDYPTRLEQIADIIEAVDRRCAAVDGPVTPTLQEMTPAELRKIYRLAKGKK